MDSVVHHLGLMLIYIELHGQTGKIKEAMIMYIQMKQKLMLWLALKILDSYTKELKLILNGLQMLTIRGMTSIGNWEYSENFKANATDIDNNVPLGEITMYMDGLKVGDAAQTTFSFGFDLKPAKGLVIYSTYSFFDNLYSDFNILEDQFYSPNPQIVKLDAYGLLDAGFSYKYSLKGFDLIFRANMNNVLDTEYVAELSTNNTDDFMSNQGYYGFGRTWNLGLKVIF